MTKTEIIKTVNEAIKSGKTVIVTPEAIQNVWRQTEVENIPNISAEEEINGKLSGITVNVNGKYSSVSIIGY